MIRKVKILSRPKLFIPLALLFSCLLLNFSLYKLHSPTNKRIALLWERLTFKTVDHYRISHYEQDDLRVELAKHFPYTKNTDPVPKQVWQMWKTNDVSKLEDGLKDLVKTWSSDPDFNHTLFDNEFFTSFIHSNFYDIPDVIEGFNRLPVLVLKSDLMRYMVLYVYGGVYSDIDTSLNTPLKDWLSYNNTYVPEKNQIGLTIGIESDRDDKEWVIYMPRRLQFCQWTLQSKSGHPFFRELIYRILDLSLNHYDPKTKIVTTKDGKKYDLNDGSGTKYAGIMEWTGPGMFTDTVFDYINEVIKTKTEFQPNEPQMINPNSIKLQKQIKYGKIKNNGLKLNAYDPIERPIGWQNLTHIEKPLIVDDDVLLLPQKYFGDHNTSPVQYVKHYFKGSWKTGV